MHPATYTFPRVWCVNASSELLGTGNPGFAAFMIAFFAPCPVASDYAVMSLMDTTFSYELLLLVSLLFEIAVQRERFWEGCHKPVCLVVACLLVGTTRNNGPTWRLHLRLVWVSRVCGCRMPACAWCR